MADEGIGPSRSIWTRRIEVPRTLARLGWVILFLPFVLGASALAFDWLTLGPGARLTLAESVHVHVPPHFTASRFRDNSCDDAVQKTYVVRDSLDEYGGLVSISALKPDAPLGFHDPARMAAYARDKHREVRGPAHFHYSGFEVTATVEPTLSRSRHEGAYTLTALIDVRGHRVYIWGDNVTLGVDEDAGPQEMATAAIKKLELSAD